MQTLNGGNTNQISGKPAVSYNYWVTNLSRLKTTATHPFFLMFNYDNLHSTIIKATQS